jgi:cyanophycinase-like exopeptidase
MGALVCLQGGNEFSAGCRAMDALLVDGLDGPVAVTALAGELGADYGTATDNGVRHFASLTGQEVLGAPDVRQQPDEALAVLRRARLIVLPGGSPSRLLAALTSTPVGEVLSELLAAGGRVMGSSAGAMVLGPWTVLPGPHPGVAPGLGLTPFVVVPHWTGSREPWISAIDQSVPAEVGVLGIPEESGVLIGAGVLTAVGQGGSRLVREQEDLPVSATRAL